MSTEDKTEVELECGDLKDYSHFKVKPGPMMEASFSYAIMKAEIEQERKRGTCRPMTLSLFKKYLMKWRSELKEWKAFHHEHRKEVCMNMINNFNESYAAFKEEIGDGTVRVKPMRRLKRKEI